MSPATVTLFLANASDLVARLRIAVQDRDFPQVRRLSRELGRSAGQASAELMVESAAALEELARARDEEGVATLIDRLTQDFETVEAVLGRAA